jgi:hypothetical protein
MLSKTLFGSLSAHFPAAHVESAMPARAVNEFNRPSTYGGKEDWVNRQCAREVLLGMEFKGRRSQFVEALLAI